VVNDQVCTPSYTVDVAEAAVQLIVAGGHGLFHVTSTGSCSWYEFAQVIFEMAGVDANLKGVSSSAYASPARRPAYSVLGDEQLRSLGLNPLRSWREALSAYLQERDRRNSGQSAGSEVRAIS